MITILHAFSAVLILKQGAPSVKNLTKSRAYFEPDWKCVIRTHKTLDKDTTYFRHSKVPFLRQAATNAPDLLHGPDYHASELPRYTLMLADVQ